GSWTWRNKDKNVHGLFAARFSVAQIGFTIPAKHPMARAFGFTGASLVTAGRVGLHGVPRHFP
ncbi:MAG: hypothetical protein ACOYMG_28350, partial [Candidatus Methylumidiphilus sp.]